MKKLQFLVGILALATLMLSACGVPAVPATTSAATGTAAVAYVGTINSMAGDQWVINGATVTVPPAVVRDGSFTVGDPVKLEGNFAPDGSFIVLLVEQPTAQELAALPPFRGGNAEDTNTNDANSNQNINGVNANDDNTNAGNVNDANSNDDNSNTGNANDSNDNDDNGVNSNGDDNDGNGNDDSGGNDNDNDDNDNGGGGNDNDDDDNSND